MDAQQFATVYALSSSVGLRAFITLALASLAMHFGYLHPAPAFAWLGTDGATLALAILAVAEFFGDKVPVLDHALHVTQFATKPIAAAILVGSAVPLDANGDWSTVGWIAVALAALNALGIHTASATVRGASTAATAGVGNPVLSLAEDVLAVSGVVLAFAAPFGGALLAILVTLALVFFARRLAGFVLAHREKRPSL